MGIKRTEIALWVVGAALGGGSIVAALLSGSDQAVLWVARVLLGFTVLRFALPAVLYFWATRRSEQPRPPRELVLVGASLGNAAGLATVLAVNFSGLGALIGIGICGVSLGVGQFFGPDDSGSSAVQPSDRSSTGG